ncbi:hypothetical protein CANINC_000773 [Pichia inconspicua]|uniref:pyridoxal kinase n=1 Tax=Pichia inconspicua TaxID=52247 RepID=A0A4T0X592_9ASCO|nr:hypothetical protein CANINC_000773 [[Candida] inconspicua]
MMNNLESTPSVLSIQSHVVHGYVGNKAACFPLQTLGWNVDILNTVNFSNHTGYGALKGTCSTKEEILEIYKGLENINVQYDALLTGYVNGYQTLQAVGEICISIKRKSIENQKRIFWMLDPVMGDEGRLYVEENVIPVYRTLLESRLVDAITPNQYELELLIEQKITCLKTLKKALILFQNRYKVKHVILSTLFASQFEDLDGGADTLYCCVSSESLERLVLFKINKIEGYFTGVGDLFSALLLDRLSKSLDVVRCVNEALSVMKRVLTTTKSLSTATGKIGSLAMRDCELRVIESKQYYELHDELYEPLFIDKY